MQSHMRLQRSNRSEKSITHVTKNIVHRKMRLQMTVENRLHRETLATVIALKRFLSRMGTYVPDQVANLLEHTATIITHILFLRLLHYVPSFLLLEKEKFLIKKDLGLIFVPSLCAQKKKNAPYRRHYILLLVLRRRFIFVNILQQRGK